MASDTEQAAIVLSALSHLCTCPHQGVARAAEVPFPARQRPKRQPLLSCSSDPTIGLLFPAIFACDRLILYFLTGLVCFHGSEFTSFPSHCCGNP